MLVWLCSLAGVIVAGALFPVVGAVGLVSVRADESVDRVSARLAEAPPPLVTTVTDSTGGQIATLYAQYRLPLAVSDVSDAMRWALVSVEDKRFYQHRGVDLKGILRAAVSTGSGGATQGASTLTQQYVKNYLINVVYRNDKAGQAKAREASIARKLKEARVAVQIETKMSKEQILAAYLNVVEFPRQVYGVAAAARAFFDTDPKNLSVAQAALLAGLVNNPSVFDPWNHPRKATERRNLVLDRMVENRKLGAADAARIKTEPLGVVPGGPVKPAANCIGAGRENGFFCQYVEDYLLTKAGMNKDDLYTGGYTVRTTMDQRANYLAKAAAEQQVKKTQKNVANTLSLVKPGKDRHEVVALAANRDYGNDAPAGQTVYALPSGIWNTGGAGSSYKIFTAAAALRQGVAGIYSTIDTPGFYTSPVFGSNNPRCAKIGRGTYAYCLGNAGDHYPGSMTLQTALATSPNTGFVILEEKTGMGPVVEMAGKLGMRETMAANLAGRAPDPAAKNPRVSMPQSRFFGPKDGSPGEGSFTLGVSPLSGLELANVAATILSGGRWCPPTPIGRISNRDGAPRQLREQACEQVLEPGLANTLAVGMSKDDQAGGTSAAAAAASGWTRPMIGKTGTTQNNASATFVGGTPQLAGAAMVFRPQGGNGGLCDGGPGNVYACDKGTMFGGKTPARTFYTAMNAILDGQPSLALPPADPRYEHAR